MNGQDLKEWRAKNSFTQERLRVELGIASRQTIISREASSRELPRMWKLALIALEEPKNLKTCGWKKK